MTCRSCFTNNGDDHYRGFLCELHTNASISTQILIILRDIELNLVIICHDNSNDAESTITKLDVQNYYFSPRGNMFGLIFKNNHEVVFT